MGCPAGNSLDAMTTGNVATGAGTALVATGAGRLPTKIDSTASNSANTTSTAAMILVEALIAATPPAARTYHRVRCEIFRSSAKRHPVCDTAPPGGERRTTTGLVPRAHCLARHHHTQAIQARDTDAAQTVLPCYLSLRRAAPAPRAHWTCQRVIAHQSRPHVIL